MGYPYTTHSTATGRAATSEDVYPQAVGMITSSVSLSQRPPAPAPAPAPVPPRESVIGDDFNGKALTRRVKGENISENHNDPYIYDEDKDFCSEIVATKESHSQQQQEQHPYMSLYEPLSFATEPAEFDACPSSSSSSSSQQQQQPDETSSAAAAAEQSPSSPSPRISNTTTSIINRVKKRQKIDYIDEKKNNDNNNVEHAFQSVVHEEDIRMNLNEQVAHIIKTFLDDNVHDGDDDDGHDDSISDYQLDNVDDDVEGNSNETRFDSSDDDDDDDDEAVIERTKLKSKLRAVGTTTATATARIVGNKRNTNCADSGSSISSSSSSNTSIRKINPSNKQDEKWEEMYQRLVAYKKEHKHTKVSGRYKEDPQLGLWVKEQRSKYRKKSIPEERKCLLNSIDFIWVVLPPEAKGARWKKMYQRLVAYKKEHMDTKVPSNYNKDPQLGRWMNKQRHTYRGGKMTEERKCLLESIDFVWGVLSTKSATCKAYKKNHKDAERGYKEDPQLGRWAEVQRTAYRDKKMAEKHKRPLNSVAFVRDALIPDVTQTTKWVKMYQQLVAYNKEHGSTKVPIRLNEDHRLGLWVRTQRYTYKDNIMTEERKRLLNSIGFVWILETNTTKWEEMYRRLVAYKMKHNDTNISTRYDEDPQLGNWVATQRGVYRDKTMTEERKRLLNSIGFVWNGRYS